MGEAFVPQDIPITPDGARLEPGTTHIPNYGRIFTPFWTEPTIMKPGSNGGANWPPSSYDPATHLLYACGAGRTSLYRADLNPAPPKPGGVYMGGFSQGQTLDAESSRPPDLVAGESLYRQGCVFCHGAEGSGGQGGGPSLLAFPAAYIAATATTGKGAAMPAFRAVYTPDQLRDIAGYVSTTLAAARKR